MTSSCASGGCSWSLSPVAWSGSATTRSTSPSRWYSSPPGCSGRWPTSARRPTPRGTRRTTRLDHRRGRALSTGPMTAGASGPYLVRMLTRPPQIVAFGGGGFSMEWGNPLLDDHVLALTGVACPRVCFLPTASGDADHYVVRFYRAFPSSRCEPSHISLFRRETGVGDAYAHLQAQDLIYVGGGSLVSLLGTWRAHGIDEVLREAWEAGVILCGGSAGALCWFEHALSGFHEGPSRQLEALGFLPASCAVHYNEEHGRREGYL